ncbi:MAG: hypothetical protein ABMB14_33860, partial [Myxococcota bacterium]
AARIAARVDDGTMPPAGGLTDEERRLLADWANCGTPGGPTTPVPADPCAVEIPFDGDVTDATAVCPGFNVVTGSIVTAADHDLSCLCRVDGDLTIASDAVTAVSAPLLASIGGDLQISGAAIATVSLPAVTTIGGGVRLTELPALTLLSVDRIDAIGGDYVLAHAPALTEWRGAQSPRSVGGSVVLDDLDGLSWIEAFGRVESLGGGITITGNDGALQVFGFQKLLEVPGPVLIADNDGAALIETLVDATSIPSGLTITDHRSLVEISGFVFLADAGPIAITRNKLLTRVPRFDGLVSTDGVTVVENPSLARIDAWFPLVTTLGPGGFVVTDNDALGGASAFATLTTTAGPVVFRDNPALTAILGFDKLDQLADLVLTGNPALGSATLPKLQQATGSVTLADAAFTAIPGLPKLHQIGQDLVLRDNPALADVTGLYAVRGVTGTLVVRGNPSLPAAAADALAATIDEVGATDIGDNGP